MSKMLHTWTCNFWMNYEFSGQLLDEAYPDWSHIDYDRVKRIITVFSSYIMTFSLYIYN